MPISKKTYSDAEKQFLKNIGFKVQFFRRKAGLSQYELAEKADLSEATISHLESTTVYGVSIIAIYRLAMALEVEPDKLLKFD